MQSTFSHLIYIHMCFSTAAALFVSFFCFMSLWKWSLFWARTQLNGAIQAKFRTRGNCSFKQLTILYSVKSSFCQFYAHIVCFASTYIIQQLKTHRLFSRQKKRTNRLEPLKRNIVASYICFTKVDYIFNVCVCCIFNAQTEWFMG